MAGLMSTVSELERKRQAMRRMRRRWASGGHDEAPVPPVPSHPAKLRVILCGQSQCAHFATASDTDDTGGLPGGSARLVSRLGQLMPGVASSWAGAATSSGSGTWAASTPMFSEFASADSFFTANPFANQTAGERMRAYIQGQQAADTAGLVVIYMHAEDASSANFNAATYAAGAQALVNALVADNAAGWGKFAILPVLSPTRGSANDAATKLPLIRRIWNALGGNGTYAGITANPAVLLPVGVVSAITLAAWNGGADYVHFVRSSALRAADLMANAAANWLAGAGVAADQPRLTRAVLVNATTLRAFWTLGRAGATFQHQYFTGTSSAGYAVSAGSISAITPVDNSLSASGQATVDMTVSGVSAGGLLRFRTGLSSGTFMDGTSSPRGFLANHAGIFLPGVTPVTVTEDAEDLKLPGDGWFLSAGHEDAGIVIEAA